MLLNCNSDLNQLIKKIQKRMPTKPETNKKILSHTSVLPPSSRPEWAINDKLYY